jgi:glutathione-regulated potassium-efflux system protein KefB
MDLAHLLSVAGIMMTAAAVAVGVARKLNLGAIVALLLVGIALGPHSPAALVTTHVSELQAVGGIGVMLLLFAIGLDAPPAQVWSMRRMVFGLGSAKYAATTAAIVAFLALATGIGQEQWQSALVVALGLAMSSTAIAVPELQARREMAAAQGRAFVAVDILETLLVVPVLALIPILGSGGMPGGDAFATGKALQVVAAVGGVYLLGRYLLPQALRLTARNLGPGGFAIVSLAAVFLAGAWLDAAGVSIALGAFMIGATLAKSVYADQVKAAVAPARQLLLALFFISIGMSIDLRQLAALKADLLLYLPGLLLVKFAVVLAVARLWLGPRAAFLSALLMIPFDEIAYVILASANAHGLLSARHYALGLGVISLSFMVSPVLIDLGYRLAARLWTARAARAPEPAARVDGIVVTGYGYVGRVIARSGHNVHYGDITDPAMMASVGLAGARLVIVTTSGYDATRRLIGSLRQFYPDVPAMTAVQYLAQRDELRRMGATQVVALTPEGALSFGRSVLGRLGVAAAQRDAIVDVLTSDDYAVLRGAPAAARSP